MVAELELAKMAKELGIEQGEDHFGNTLDNDAWLDFVAKYVVRRRNEISKDIQYLRTTATRKNAKAMAEKYGVDVKDPDGMKKALREAESLRDRWKSPYTDAELMEEMKGAYRAEHPEGGEGSQSERIMADYSRQVGEMANSENPNLPEGVTHFSTSGDVMRVSKEEVPENREKLKEYLKNLANKAFHNAKSNITATITRESAKKIANADNGSAVNLMRLGYSEEEARYIHRAAAVKIGELFEKSELYFEEAVYHKKDNRERAWHFFEPVNVELNGEQEIFLSNISVVEYRDAGERIFSLEMTIENPIGDREDMAAPQKHGRQALYPNGVSDVRLAAFDSFVKKEKAQIERNARQQGLIPWRVNEQTVRELEAEKAQKSGKHI